MWRRRKGKGKENLRREREFFDKLAHDETEMLAVVEKEFVKLAENDQKTIRRRSKDSRKRNKPDGKEIVINGGTEKVDDNLLGFVVIRFDGRKGFEFPPVDRIGETEIVRETGHEIRNTRVARDLIHHGDEEEIEIRFRQLLFLFCFFAFFSEPFIFRLSSLPFSSRHDRREERGEGKRKRR